MTADLALDLAEAGLVDHIAKGPHRAADLGAGAVVQVVDADQVDTLGQSTECLVLQKYSKFLISQQISREQPHQ